MLEYWLKERRTLVDYRRGPLGPYFDGLSARLTERKYSKTRGGQILGIGCLFNYYLIDQGITHAKVITEELVESFLDYHLAEFRTTSNGYIRRAQIKGLLKHLLTYLIDTGVVKPVKLKWLHYPGHTN